jgi:hypothetical protein
MLPETMNVLSVVVGVALILVGLRDVFHTLFHPAGRGGVSTWVMRGTWRVSRWPRGSPSPLAGPVGIVLVIVVWAALQVFGWTLIYLPQIEPSPVLCRSYAGASTGWVGVSRSA